MDKGSGKVVGVRVPGSALDDIPMGIVRINTGQRIAYMNSAARTILGEHITVGAYFSEIPMTEESRSELEANLTARRGGQGSTYELELLSPRWGTQTLVEVTGVPEYDSADNIVGSLGFLRNRSFESANLNVHLAIEESATWKDLLRRLAAELHKVIAYDSFLVTLVSEERRHLRTLFEDPVFANASPIRW